MKQKQITLPPWIKAVEERRALRILRVQGRVDMTVVAHMEKFSEKMRNEKGFEHKQLLLDFADVSYIDTSVVAVLLKTMGVYKKTHHKLGIINLGEEPRNMLEITKVDKLFILYENEAQAVQALEAE